MDSIDWSHKNMWIKVPSSLCNPSGHTVIINGWTHKYASNWNTQITLYNNLSTV